jgi:hypothetical protein
VDNTHSKKIFKNKDKVLSDAHKLFTTGWHSSVLALPAYADVQTDLFALIKVSKSFNTYRAFCHLFDRSIPLLRSNRGDPEECVRALFTLDLSHNHWTYSVLLRGAIDVEDPEMASMLSEDNMYKYTSTLAKIPNIVREIARYLPNK